MDKEKPKANVTPEKQEVKEGQPATFYCKIEGFPEPQIEWRRADGRPMRRDVRIEGNRLLIPDASMSDKTMYYCRATNTHGYAEATGSLEVSGTSYLLIGLRLIQLCV